jgi:hypothetical protein
LLKIRILQLAPQGAPRMDVDLTIRYSDDRLSEDLVCRPNDPEPLYRIVTRRANLSESLTEAMQEARRLFADDPWPDRRQRNDAWPSNDSDLAKEKHRFSTI